MKKDRDFKMFVLRKYVRARNALEAVKIAKTKEWDEVYISEDWKEGKNKNMATAIGFDDGRSDDDEE